MLLQRKCITLKTIQKFVRLKSFLQEDSQLFDRSLCHSPCPHLSIHNSRNSTWVWGGIGALQIDLQYLLQLCIYTRSPSREKQLRKEVSSYSTFANQIFFHEQAMRSKEKKISAKSKLSSVRLAYSVSVLRCANIFAQLSSRSFRFFRSFQLSGSSFFMVVPAFRSFQLSGLSSFSPVVAVTAKI